MSLRGLGLVDEYMATRHCRRPDFSFYYGRGGNAQVYIQPRIFKDERHQIQIWRQTMHRVYVLYEGKRYTRVSNKRYEYAVLARYTTMIEQVDRDDVEYEYLHDLLSRGAKLDDFGMMVSWASTRELAEKKQRKMQRRFADVTIRKAKYSGEVYAVRYYTHRRSQDYDMVEPIPKKVP